MKILVFVNTLGIGGTEWNSIEIGARLRDTYGHDVVLFGTPGPMVRLAEEKGIRFIAAPRARLHPSPTRVAALCAAVRRERPDLIQAWDYRAGLDAFYASLVLRVPVHISHGNMVIERVLPRHVPITFMTPELADRARAMGRSPVGLVFPPVDVSENRPGASDAGAFRQHHGLGANDIVLVTVSRLVNLMKGESLRQTIRAVRALGTHFPIKFVLVGDGEARIELETMATDVNAHLGRKAVVLTGPLLDPRPAYDAADIVIGMGGSALRGMAFAKPVIIVGKDGFSAPFDADSAPDFYYKGMYGLGDGEPGDAKLIANIRSMIERPDRAELGAFSLDFVRSHHSLEATSARIHEFSSVAIAERPRFRTAIADALRTGLMVAGNGLVPGGVREWVRRRRSGYLQPPRLPAANPGVARQID